MQITIMNVVMFILLFGVVTVAAYTDLKTRKINDYLIIPAIAVVLIIRIFHHPLGWTSYLWGITPALLLFVASLLTKGKGFGGGDIKLFFFIGLLLGGWPTFAIFVICFVVILIYVGLAFVIANKKFPVVPMAPFLLLSLVIYFTYPYWLVPLLS